MAVITYSKRDKHILIALRLHSVTAVFRLNAGLSKTNRLEGKQSTPNSHRLQEPTQMSSSTSTIQGCENPVDRPYL